jgi:hypothetical protein
MVRAINFDDELGRMDGKVRYVRANWNLPSNV